MTLFKHFKSELLCKLQANEYLMIRDIESANRKVKLEIDNYKTPPGKKHKVYGIPFNMDQ